MISIFNDVIGPVMRGPSSSHCAAALRIGRLARDLIGGDLQEILVEFDRGGALATTHDSQGSDMGLFGGLMGWEADDERLPNSAQAIRDAGVQTRIAIIDSADPHPNTYRLTLCNATHQHSLKAISTGGGIIEVIEIDGFPLSIGGDYHETLVRFDGDGQSLIERLGRVFAADEILLHHSDDQQLLQVKAPQFVADEVIAYLLMPEAVRFVKRLSPVLPVPSRKGVSVPFSTCEQMLRHDADKGSPLWKLAIQYESCRGNLSEEEVVSRMADIVAIVRRSIAQGIDGTQYEDRLLGHQCGTFQSRMEAGSLLPGGVVNRIILYVTALMEVKSAMGVIVAAPTAGACAALPGAILAVADELNLPEESAVHAMLAAGLIGALIATRSTFAAEVAGCQAECGSAACMAAAGLVTLAHGSTQRAIAAASMALQSSLGMVCSPVAGRVEVPCLGNNVMAAANALASAN
ncbi:MAG TPA: L-serine ammonia-lyase, iron-sulfur-dependent, subunit alpha, partial [Thermoguttaceae bacterium]|nr:L-serine ammonia-lyase, iron-sulfur-dependent, subunit alpha [Thermoguttaceae bacterium]